MDPLAELKLQRDRFLAFSFAGADLLIEINPAGLITFIAGSVRALTGADDKDLLNTKFSDLFSHNDSNLISIIQNGPKKATKTGPYLVSIKNFADPQKTKRVFLSSLKMLPDGATSIAISQGDGLHQTTGFEDTVPPPILSINDFEAALRKKIPELMAQNKNTNVQMLQIGNIDAYKQTMGAENWDDFVAKISETIMAHSLDGETAVKVDNGKFLLLNDGKSSSDHLNSKLLDLAKTFQVDRDFDIKSKDITTAPDSLNAHELSRAVLYTINKMEKTGIESCDADFKTSFHSYLKENTTKITNLKRIISHQEFNIHFQPIVDIKTEKISHHEVLVRFDSDNSPYDLIIMGEDVGIAPDIDLSICRQCIKYVDFNTHKSLGKFAVNVSGASIQNNAFMGNLYTLLKEYPKAAKHIIFEITESSEIKDFEKVNGFIQSLRKNGYTVCLDDFGAGAASFQYLNKLHIDGVKIDGSYVKTILTSPRDATMVKNITKMCHELDVYVVAEMIETREQARFLLDIGVDKGQGWLYGKAAPTPLASIPKTN
jgi:EAL domain-containing protein (putative c-di-GMP-specific phosphodiesterase class I)